MIRSFGHGLTAYLPAAFALAAGAAAWAGTLEGTATYRERVALPPGAVFEAVLQDVSRADAPAKELGRAKIDPAGQPPFRFEIAYDDADVQPRRRYAVRATVRHQDGLLFTTDRNYPVLAGEALPAIAGERGAVPHQRQPSRNARCGRCRDCTLRGRRVALNRAGSCIV